MNSSTVQVDFSKDKFVQNTAFYLDFAQIPARPHGIATSRQYIGELAGRTAKSTTQGMLQVPACAPRPSPV